MDKNSSEQVPVIDLSIAPGAGEKWGRGRTTVYLWALAEILFVTNPVQISSRLRIRLLRMFGATIGNNVVMRPRVRVKYPWNLAIGDNSWIGEGVWFHNQDQIQIGNNCVVSQESMLTTGSHAFRTDMALITRPVVLDDGAWVTTRCIVLGGSRIGRSAVIAPGSVIGPNEHVEENTVVTASKSGAVSTKRFNFGQNGIQGHD